MDSMTMTAATAGRAACGTTPSWERAALRPRASVLLPLAVLRGTGASTLGQVTVGEEIADGGVVSPVAADRSASIDAGSKTAHRYQHASVRRSDDL